MAYAIGFMLPIIVVVGGGIWLLMAIAEDASNKREVQKMIDENARELKEKLNR